MPAGYKGVVAFVAASCFVMGYAFGNPSSEQAPIWARLFWSLFGFSQGYLVCWWTPHYSDWAVPRMQRWLAARARRRAARTPPAPSPPATTPAKGTLLCSLCGDSGPPPEALAAGYRQCEACGRTPLGRQEVLQ